MTFIYLLLILNIVVSNRVILAYRLSLAGMPINMIEGAILLTALYVLLVPIETAPMDRTRRNYLWPIVSFWVVACSAGALLGFAEGAHSYRVIQMLKWSLKMPLSVVLGYFAVRRLRDVRRMIKFISFLSCIVCIIFVIRFSSGSAEYRVTQQSGVIRALHYNYDAMATIAIFVIYSAAVNPRFFSRVTGPVILTMSVIGVLATLTRSTIVSLAVSILAAIGVIPKGYRSYAWKALFTSGKWVVIAVVLAALLSQFVLGVNVVGTIVGRFKGAEGAEGSAVTRWEGAINELKIWLGSTIIFGRGFGTVQEAWDPDIMGSWGHNGYTATLAKIGIVGFVAMIYPAFVAIHIGRRMVRQIDPDVRAAGTLMMAGAFYLAILSFLSSGFATESSGVFFGLIMGMGVKCYRFQVVPQTVEQQSEEYYWHEQQLQTTGGAYEMYG